MAGRAMADRAMTDRAMTDRTDAPHITGRGIDNCGHYVHEEAPDILVQELLEFGKG